jgi:hypothetical protein
MWATGISLALVLGSGLIALGAGAFAEPPVDRAGTFAAINAEFTPAPAAAPRATTPPRTAPRGPHAGASRPRNGAPFSRTAHARPIAGPTPGSAAAPSYEVEPGEATTGRAGTTTTPSDDAHESAEHESPERESQEHESQEHESPEHEPDD